MTLTKKITLNFALIALFIGTQAEAQSIELNPVSKTYAITNAVIVQGPGRTIPAGTVLIKDGLIVQIGTSVAIPTDAVVIDADSMYVYPGFIDGLSQAGIPNPEEKQRPRDVLAMDPPYEWAGIAPQASATDFLKSGDRSLTKLKEAGFTISQVVPKGQMIPGKGAIVLLNGAEKSKMVYTENSTLYSQLQGANGVFPNTVIGVMAKWRDLYRNAYYADIHNTNYEANPAGMERPEFDPVLTALTPVTKNQQTVTFKANDDLDIHRVITLKKDLGFDLVLADVESGWNAIDNIKSSGAKVFLNFDLPDKPKVDSTKSIETDRDREIEQLEKRKMEAYQDYVSQAAKFEAAGIPFGFSSIGAKPADLKKNLIAMIEAGLSEDMALSALTTTPAAILGISEVAGTVDVGKMANIIVSTGPYFSKDSDIKFVFVDGVMNKYSVKDKKKASSNSGKIPILGGTWDYTIDSEDGESTGIIKFVDEDGDFSGSMSNSQVQVPGDIVEVTINGSDVAFIVRFSVDGQFFDIEATVTVIDGEMKGDLLTPFGDAKITAEKNPNK